MSQPFTEPTGEHDRAIVLALWPKLQAAEWGPKIVRRLDHYNTPPCRSIATASIPNAPARDNTDITIVRLALIATTTADPPHIVLLTEGAYQAALLAMAGEEFKAHQQSLTGERLPPYRWNVSRGRAYLAQRLHGWHHDWSDAARAALHRIAEHAITWPAKEPPPRRFHRGTPTA